MKKYLFYISVIFLTFLLMSCQKEYDPIGNNKPAPLLKLIPPALAFDGVGGEFSVDIETNAEDLKIGTYPNWIASVNLSEDKKKLVVTAKPNEDNIALNQGSIKIETLTGSNEAVQTLFLIQAAAGAKITYDAFNGKKLNLDVWKPFGNYTIGSGCLTMKGDGNKGTELMCLAPSAKLTQPNNINTITVDVKDGESGLKVYVNEDLSNSTNFWTFFFIYNPMDNKGAVYVFNKYGPCALGDAVPGNPLNPSQKMDDIPPLGERDEYFRLEVTNAYKWPNWWKSEFNIYSLKTVNGVQEVLKKHYTRNFEFDMPKPSPGYVSVWARGGQCNFRNFMVSAQNN